MADDSQETSKNKADTAAGITPLRVVIQQPSLAKYRVPVYRNLAARPGIDLHLYHGDWDGIPNVTSQGFASTPVPIRALPPGQRVKWHRAQWSLASRNHADVLVLSWDIGYLSLVPALLRARAAGVGTVLWGHGYSKRGAGLSDSVRQRVGKLADALLFYNRAAADRHATEFGHDPKRLFVAPNTIDQAENLAAVEHWQQKPDDLKHFANQHGLDPTQTLLFISRLYPGNRSDLLLHATKKLSNDFPNLKTVIVGKGPHEPELHRITADLALQDRVIFTGPIYDPVELAPWALNASLFCYPENVGLSLLHAMGMGLPVVTADNIAAQNPEIEALRDGHNGLLYRHGDPDDMISKLHTLLTDHALRTEMSQTAYQTAHEVYTLDAMVDGMETAIRFAADRP